MSKSHSFDNPGYNHDHSHVHTHQPGLVIANPPPDSGVGLFLENDRPIIVQPSAHGTGPTDAINYLQNVPAIFVKQKIELLEVLTNFDTQNRFTLFDANGQTVFYALEDSDCCVRQCCGPARPFEMKILDLYQNEIIHISRPLACQSCCCFCCLMNVEVTSPPGTVVGTVQQTWSLIYPAFDVRDATGETIYKISGPCWTCSCGGDITFKILSSDGKDEVGEISKTWGGFAREYLTDADNFRITFPKNANVSRKAILLGALFLIDVMYFERKKNK